MNCPSCNAVNPDGGRFCMTCGQPLSAVTASSATDVPATASAAKMTTSPTAPPIAALPVNSAAGMQSLRVVVTDVNMQFGSMVVFMIKWALAAIPAAIVLVLAFALISAIFGGLLGGILSTLF